jgi:phenylacetate-CoA ligase
MLYDKLVKHVILPLYLFKNKNNTLKRLAILEKGQYLSADEIEKKQIQKLKILLNHCYQNVPFYKARFDGVGFNPQKFSALEDLKQIPYLTKEDIQNNLNMLTAANFNNEELLPYASGGSTVKPTNFYKDLRRMHDSRADQMRHDRWCGWDIGEKFATLWGAQREFEKQPSIKAQIVEKFIYRTYGFNAFDISEKKILEHIETLKKIKPSMILAYANVAFLFANIILNKNIDLSNLKLKGVICSAETLTEEKRKTIESAFHCKVLNRYVSREVGLVASECLQQQGLHIDSDSVFVEIESNGKESLNGEAGEIIVTDLWNYGMPFIRYQMGDVGIKTQQKCSCGRTLPMIKEVKGRTSDFIVDSKGNLVHGEYFTHLFYGLKGVQQFQLIQEDINNITLRILPRNDFTVSDLNPVIDKIKICLGKNVEVVINICMSSFVEQSGKFRFTISKINNNYFRGL